MAAPRLMVHTRAGLAATVASSINRLQSACVAEAVQDALVSVGISETCSQDRTIWETLTGLSNITAVKIVYDDSEKIESPTALQAT